MVKLIQAVDKSLALVENYMIVAIVTVMVLMAFLQVFLRNFFDTGLLWGDIFLRHLVLWVGFIGASLATRDEKHINIDALSRLAPEKSVPYIRFLVESFTIVVCIVLAKAAWNFVAYEMEDNSILFNVGETAMPAWIFQLIIPVGFGLIAFRFLLKILGRIFGVPQPEKTSPETK